MWIKDLDYELPAELIATRPAEPRDHSRLLVFHAGEDRVEHCRFYELPRFLRATDLLVVNDTRVIPAKLQLHKATGGAVPGLFLSEPERGVWELLLRTRGKVREGDNLIGGNYQFRLLERMSQKGMWRVTVLPADDAGVVLARIGQVPLPPYIEKMRGEEVDEDAAERVRYQTVYAEEGKSVAAPTAGLHFTNELLSAIAKMGVLRATVNLEVGLGTFLPVEAETLEEHPMHTENFSIPAETVAAVRRQRERRGTGGAAGGRIVVVGTTAVRALESAADQILGVESGAPPVAIREATALKISPGYTFQLTDLLVTNFHLPRSTLMALVGAMIGMQKLKALYALAIQERYRFYSYGDAMLILP